MLSLDEVRQLAGVDGSVPADLLPLTYAMTARMYCPRCGQEQIKALIHVVFQREALNCLPCWIADGKKTLLVDLHLN